jgi:hypothetical protein
MAKLASVALHIPIVIILLCFSEGKRLLKSPRTILSSFTLTNAIDRRMIIIIEAGKDGLPEKLAHRI